MQRMFLASLTIALAAVSFLRPLRSRLQQSVLHLRSMRRASNRRSPPRRSPTMSTTSVIRATRQCSS